MSFHGKASGGISKFWTVFSGYRLRVETEKRLLEIWAQNADQTSNVLAEGIFIVLSYDVGAFYESSELQEIKDSVTICANILLCID